MHQSGVDEARIRDLAERYLSADRTVIAWCLGITQQEHGVDTVREIMNLLLLRGNIGREGAGPSPVRGHSNVQGNRTCGINHRPPAELLDRLEAVCGIRSPRKEGLDTVATIRAMLAGDVKVFVSMGGNFSLAAPDTQQTFAALRSCDLTVQVSTKLNRSHLVHGRSALILPCLGRSEKDFQRGGRAGSDRRGLDEHGAPLARDEAAGIPRSCGPSARSSPAWPAPRCRAPPRRGSPSATTTTASATSWRRSWTASRTSTGGRGNRSGSASASRRGSGCFSHRRSAPSSATRSCPTSCRPRAA